RTPEQPAQLTLVLTVSLENVPKPAEAPVLEPRPGIEIVEIVDQAGDARAFDPEPEVPPRLLLDRSEIIVGDVEAAGEDASAVGDRKLLMVAQQIASAPARLEAAEMAA